MARLYANPIDKVDRIKRAFSGIDQDKDGLISAKDLRHFLTTIGEKLSEEQVNQLYKEAQVAEDSVFNIDAFMKLMGVAR